MFSELQEENSNSPNSNNSNEPKNRVNQGNEEEKVPPKAPISGNVKNLMENPIIKTFSKFYGLMLPILTCLMFGSLAFGWH